VDSFGAALASDSLWRGGPDCAIRQCTACHANDGLAPGFEGSQAAAAPPFALFDPQALDSREHSYDFARDIQPILDRSCATTGCHDAQTHAGAYVSLSGNLVGLDLSGSPSGRTTVAYRSLMAWDLVRDDQNGQILERRRMFVVPGSARDSRLMQRLGSPCRYSCSGWAGWGMPEASRHPEDRLGALSDQERWQIVEWIDAGAAFFGSGVVP
jgi:hypothetical protein